MQHRGRCFEIGAGPYFMWGLSRSSAPEKSQKINQTRRNEACQLDCLPIRKSILKQHPVDKDFAIPRGFLLHCHRMPVCLSTWEPGVRRLGSMQSYGCQ
eukprot:6458550-Amphidinium_carterae.1